MLTDQDICNWYHAIQFLLNGVDSIFWRKRVKNLEMALGMKLPQLNYHRRFHCLKRQLHMRQLQTRKEFQRINFPRWKFISQAARLAYYSMPVVR